MSDQALRLYKLQIPFRIPASKSISPSGKNPVDSGAFKKGLYGSGPFIDSQLHSSGISIHRRSSPQFDASSRVTMSCVLQLFPRRKTGKRKNITNAFIDGTVKL